MDDTERMRLAREKARKRVAELADREMLTTLADDRRPKGVVSTRKIAIQNHCRECMNWNSDGARSLAEAIRNCPAPRCWLWPWRSGAVDDDGWER